MVWRRLRARNGVGWKPQGLISNSFCHQIFDRLWGRVDDTPMSRAITGLADTSHKICDAHIWTRHGTNDFLGRQAARGET